MGAQSQERLPTSGSAWARRGVGTAGLCALAILIIGAVPSCRAHAQQPSPDAAPGALDEAAIKRMAHVLFDAYDRADPDRFAEAVGPAFVLIDDGRANDRGAVIGEIRARRDRHAPNRSRTTKDEKVWMGGGSAVFFGESVEHFLPDGPKIFGDIDGYVTLVWTNDGGRWKAVSWQWIQGGLAADRAEWNATYADSLAGRAPTGTGRWYNPEPNAFLVEMVRTRKPGFALDVAMGQGRNALYLASKGWRVTGIDISDEALREARLAASERGLRIDAQNAEAATWDFGTAQWDLVTFVYAAGCPRPSQDGACGAAIIEKLRKGLKPGGMVVVEGPHKDTRPWGFDTGELSTLFKGDFTILHDDVVDDVSDWATRPASNRRSCALRRQKIEADGSSRTRCYPQTGMRDETFAAGSAAAPRTAPPGLAGRSADAKPIGGRHHDRSRARRLRERRSSEFGRHPSDRIARAARFARS